jgi:2'-5' RNA ligase
MDDRQRMGRLFWAIPLDREVREALRDHLRAELGRAGLPGRVPRPESWHITMRFLGQVTRSHYEKSIEAWSRHPIGRHFEVTIGALGAFPRPERASVLWIGITDPEDGLGRLARLAEQSAVEAGFEPEKRAFHPHLTLSRLKPPANLRDYISRVRPLDRSMKVEQVVLYRSHLSSQGAHYEALDRFFLDG